MSGQADTTVGTAPARGSRLWHGLLAGTLLATTLATVSPIAVPLASAAGTVTLLEKNVAPVTTLGAPAMPGATVTYTISYDCSGLILGDHCAGALLTDTLPTFIDIYGNTNQLEFVSASATAPNDWVFQGVSGTVPTQSVSWLGANNVDCNPPPNTPNNGLCAGDSGAVILVLRVPNGIVPFTTPSQTVLNTATVSLTGQVDDQSTTATSYINALSAASNISKTGPATALLNAAGTGNVPYTIKLCPQANRPLWPAYVVTDTLPVGATPGPLPFGGVFTPGTASTEIPPVLPATEPTLVPGTGGTIVWTIDENNLPPHDAQGCLTIAFDVTFQNKFAGGDLSNVIGATKTNSVSAVGSGGGSQNIGPATTTLTLNGPVTRFGPSKNTGGNYYIDNASPDNAVTYFLGASNTSDAEAVAFSTATLVDGPFPTQFTLTEIRTGTWDGAVATVTASIETSPDGLAWTQVATAPNTTITLGLGAVRYVRWVFTSVGAPAIGPGWDATGQQLKGTVAGSPTATLTNCATLSGVQAGVTQSRGTACADLLLEVPQPHPSIAKTAPNTLDPGATITYTLVAANNIDATDVLVDPQVTDCLPDSAHLVVSNLRAGGSPLPANGWAVESGPTPSSCTPTGPSAPNSGTFIQLQYTGTLNPGQSAPSITYDVTADSFQFPTVTDTPTLPGLYTNTAKLTKANSTDFGHCVQAGCQASKTVTVPINAQLQSEKLVKGALDIDFNKAGTTTPGGQVTWKLLVQNVGNVEVENTQYIDVFSFVGDRGVRVTTKRGSEFVPYLVSPIVAPVGWVVEYSLANNPCRPEVLGPNTSCTAPAWTTTPNLASLPLYKSVRFTYVDRILIGATLEFSFDMVTPVFDPTYDTPNQTAGPYDLLDECTIPESSPAYPGGEPGNTTLVGSRTEEAAWVDSNGDGIQQVGEGGPTCPRASNSFAYGVSVPTDQLGGLPNPGRLGAEPPKVDLHVAGEPLFNVIGNRVWEDYDNDGIQDASEPGIEAVRVALYDGNTLIDTTFTDPNGNYLFEELPDGTDYVVRFYMPDARGYISPRDASGQPIDQLLTANNTDDDSDIPRTPTGSDGIGNYYDTVAVELGNDPASLSESDPTWDAGIWIPKPAIDLKKYVNGVDAQTITGPQIPKGAPVTWTYDITNTGNSYLKNVTLTDDVTISSQTDPVPVCNWAGSSDPLTPANVLSRGETVSCTASSVAITGQYGNNATVVGTPTLDDGTTAVNKTNVPTSVSDSDPAHYFGVEYDLALAKVANVSSVIQGGTVIWTIRVVNQGNVASGAYTVTDTLSAGLSLTSSNPVVTSSVGRTHQWVMPSLAPGATADIVLTTTVDDILYRSFRNWAEISSDSSNTYNTTDFDSLPNATTGDDNSVGSGVGPDDQVIDNTSLVNIPDTVANDEDDNDYAEVTGDIRYDLALVKTVNPTPLIGPDGLATWTITIKNQGNVASRLYTVTDNIPAGLQLQSSSPVANSSAGRTYSWIMPNLAPGATATITIVTLVTDQSRKPFVNWAEISADGSSYYDTVVGTVTDADSFPDGFLGDDPSTGSGTGPTNSALVAEPNIDRTANSDVNTDIANDEDDSDQAVLGSEILYDLALVKTVGAPTVAPNGTITWTVTVKNQGNVPSGAYTITDTVPTGLTVTGSTPAATSHVCQVYLWTMPSLAAGDTTTVVFTTTINDVTKRQFRNWAEISSDSAALYATTDDDSTPDANTGADTGAGTDLGSVPNDVVIDQTVLPQAQHNDRQVDEDDNDHADVSVPVTYDLALVKTVSPTVVGQDGDVTWTIVVQNQGNLPSGSFVVRDVLPAGMTFQSSVPDPTSNPIANVYTFTIDNLAPGASTTITIVSRATDLKLRPFRNIAEISSDSANTYSVPGSPVTDIDSVPDANTANDGTYPTIGATPGTGIDNLVIGDAGNDPDNVTDQDDADIADVISNVVYDLALAKVVNSPTASYLDTPTWTVRVYNQGNVRSGAVQVTDKLPTGLSFDSAEVFTSGAVLLGGALCSVATFTVTCSIPQIAAGDYVDIVIVTTITGNNLSTSPWRNWAEISSDSAQLLYGVNDQDSIPNSNTGRDGTLPSDDAYVGVTSLGATYVPGPGYNDPQVDQDDNDDAVVVNSGVYDLALVKVADDALVTYDQTIAFTISIKNQGNLPSGAYVVTDRVPLGITPVNISGGTYNAFDRTITWTMPNLAAGATITRTYTATIADINLRPYRNIAEISDDSAFELYHLADVDSTPNTDPQDDGTYPAVGSEPGTSTDNLLLTEAGNETEEDDADIADVNVDVRYDLALSKVVDATDLANNGPDTGTATYTVTVQNQGTVPSHGFVVTDWVPVGLDPVLPIANSGVWNSGQRTITWTMPNMLPGATLTRAYTVTIADITQRPYRNIAEITSDSAGDYSTLTETISDADSDPDSNTANDGTYPGLLSNPGDGIDNLAIGEAGNDPDPVTDEDDADIADLTYPVIYDLALVKVNDGPAVVQYDDTIQFTITVQNQGNVQSHDFTFVDTIPAGLALVDADGGVVNGGTITWTIANLAPGATTTRTITMTIDDITLRSYRNIAEINTDSADDYDARGLDGEALIDIEDIDSVPDTNAANDGPYPPLLEVPVPGTDTDNLLITEAGNELYGTADPQDHEEDDADIADVGVEVRYDLALAKVASAPTIAPDGSVVFTITVLNQGTVPSGDYQVTDTLPAGMQATAASDDGDRSVPGFVTWNLTASLAPGASRELTITATISDITQRPFKNIAEISDDSSEDYNVDDVLFITVTDDDSTPDDTTNNDNPQVVDGPDGYGTLEDPLNDVTTPGGAEGPGNGGEDDADVAFVDAPVLYDLALVKTGPAEIDGMGNAVFTISIKNQGNVPSGNFTVRDEVPTGLSVVSISDGGAAIGSVVTWNLSGLAAGATTSVTLTLRIADFSTRPWVNFAEISADGADVYDTDGYETLEAGDVEDDDSAPNTDMDDDVLVDQTELPDAQYNDPDSDEDDHDIAPIDANIDYDLALVKVLPGGQTFKLGNDITFRIDVMNQGNVDSGPVTVMDVLPAGLTLVSASNGGLAGDQTVTWQLENLTPGQIVSFTVVVKMTNITLPSYINYAEIVEDGADGYDIEGGDIEDSDSTPDVDITNDLLVDTDDVTIDVIVGDSDDHDRALLDPGKVASDNPVPPQLPATGGDTVPLVWVALATLLAGSAAGLIGRRRRMRDI